MPAAAPVPEGDLLADIDAAPVPDRARRWSLDLSPAWNVFYAFGGTTMAATLRAAERATDRPDLHLLTASATFCSPVPSGPITLDGRLLRSGRTAAQATAELRVGAPGDLDGTDAGPAIHLAAVFGERRGLHVDYVDLEYPGDVPPVDDCEDVQRRGAAPGEGDNPFLPINYHHQIDWRPAIGATPTDRDWAPGPARYAAWMRFRNEPRRGDGTLDPVALAVPGDSLGGAIWQRLGPFGPDNPPFLVLSLEITLHVLADTDTSWILQHVRCHHARDGYAVGTTEMWDERHRLVGLAVQRAKLRPFHLGEDLGPR
jgi:acyl-CoA thioesterase